MVTAVSAGCLFCKTGCDVCAPSKKLPNWFREGATTPSYQLTNVARGKHPFGARLSTHGYCETCFFAQRGTRRMCTKFNREVRFHWRACEKYEDNPC